MLNKEDIISLGFLESNWPKTEFPIFGRWNSTYMMFGNAKSPSSDKRIDGRPYGITLYFDNIVDPAYIRIDGKIAPGAVYGHIGSPLFKGYIHSKEELKTLLKQLGIGFNEK